MKKSESHEQNRASQSVAGSIRTIKTRTTATVGAVRPPVRGFIRSP